MKYLLLFNYNIGYTNSHKCYVAGALPVLSCAIAFLYLFYMCLNFCIIISLPFFLGMHVHANSDFSTTFLTQYFNKQGVNCVFIIVDTTPHPTSIIML